MPRPVIAVTADRRALGPKPLSSRVRPARPEVYVHEDLIQAVREAGGEPLLLPPQERPAPEWLDWVLSSVGGLVISGGAVDIHPRHYGQEVLGRLDGVDEGRAGLELALAREALRRGVPVLGICGGMQALAVASGGTLIQDIATALPAAGSHEQATDPAEGWHEVRLEGEEIVGIFGGARILVNSTHHQSVDAPGAFAVVGRTADGVAEVIWCSGYQFALGVQWHPESLAPQEGLDVRAPFRALVGAALRRAAR